MLLCLAEPWGLQSLFRNCGIKSLRAQMIEMGLGSGGLMNVLSRKKKVLICSICLFLWCKYFHCGLFQAAKGLITVFQNS